MRLFICLSAALLLFVIPRQANAIPVFAHRYGLQCQACHTTVPHLNVFGQAFARNGFRLPHAGGAGVPVAVKVNLAYSSDASSNRLPKAIVDEVELLTGGAIGSRFNYFLEQYAVDGGVPGNPRDAWVQYNDGNGNHVRAGEFTLPLPVDPETQRDTLAHYLIYDQRVGGNAFAFFDARTGMDVYRENDRGDSVHLALFSGSDLMAYGAKAFGNLSLYAYRYQDPRFFRQALGARQQIGRLDVVAVTQRGKDAFGDSGGGFAEAHYTFSPALMAVARYDRAWDSLSGSQQQTVVSLVTRPARNMRFTIEDQVSDHHTLGMGLLFAY